ncbi:hypothetical protein BEN30_09505 [Magnetovibrio blakemorei]|uniref:DUF3306 domain-containing protein n=1 Tax=Magnetovibrio blakemorei TaxID=28181 RepID=A0A1E5Q888_9PROT|nr:hypothetical protein BEN30_09505 [Magnetovibrio blakemorei]
MKARDRVEADGAVVPVAGEVLPAADDPNLVSLDAPSQDAPSQDLPPPDLPDVETLNADSDYTGFLGKNVPQDLTNQALRKLWRSDPVLSNLDGLNDYDEDYSKIGMVSEVVKTAYRIGQGYLMDDLETKDAADDVNAPGENDGEGGADDGARSEVPSQDESQDTLTKNGENSSFNTSSEGESEDEDFHSVEFIKSD